MSDNSITIVGNVVREFGLEFTGGGTAYVSFSIAVNRRVKKGENNYEDETSYFDVTAWQDHAKNISETLGKGSRVIVQGRLEQQRWEKDGEKRSKVVIQAEEVGPSLRWATAEVTRTPRPDNENR